MKNFVFTLNYMKTRVLLINKPPLFSGSPPFLFFFIFLCRVFHRGRVGPLLRSTFHIRKIFIQKKNLLKLKGMRGDSFCEKHWSELFSLRSRLDWKNFPTSKTPSGRILKKEAHPSWFSPFRLFFPSFILGWKLMKNVDVRIFRFPRGLN